MANLKMRQGYNLIGHATQILTDGEGYRFQLETITTQGEPIPLSHNPITGQVRWDEEDPFGSDYDATTLFVTLVTASLDDDGQPDMTMDRVVTTISIA
jgi:hypothetical protein